MIPTVEPYIPDRVKYSERINKILSSKLLTNRGPMVQELESRLVEYLGVNHVICVANGSAALQVIYKALGLSGVVATTPFSFAATSSTLVWEGLVPEYVDIRSDTLNLDASRIKDTASDVSAIVATHVYGNPCEVAELTKIAQERRIPLIFDAAHAFGVEFNSNSILSWGDASALSFHATKLFHTIEGGAVVVSCAALAKEVRELINFGIKTDGLGSQGTNLKMNEFEAAMGLCILDEMPQILSRRKEIGERYFEGLARCCDFQKWSHGSRNLHAYAPVIFKSEQELEVVLNQLMLAGVQARRYFYPSLDEVGYVREVKACSNSRDISRRIICLPMFPNLSDEQQSMIIQNINNSIATFRMDSVNKVES